MKVRSPSQMGPNLQPPRKRLSTRALNGAYLDCTHWYGRTQTPVGGAISPRLGPELRKGGKSELSSRHNCSPVPSALHCDASGCFEFLLP